MKNFISFFFLILTCLFGTLKSDAAGPPCTDLSIFSPGSTIVDLGGGNYAYRIRILNAGTALTGVSLDISIATTQFSCSNLSGVNLMGGGTITPVDFPLTTPIEDITTPGAFGAIPTITVGGANPSPNCEITAPIIINTDTWGCMDPSSLNYDASATFDNNSCIDDICGFLEILNITVGTNSAGDAVLLFTFQNNGPYALITSLDNITPFLGGPNIPASFTVNNGASVNLNVAANGGIQTVPFLIANGLSDLIDSVLTINGTINVNAGSIPSNCDLPIVNYEIDITHLGCQDVSAFNYNPSATMDNGSCIENISVGQTVINPICVGDPGSVDLDIQGGTPTYSVNTYSQDLDELDAGSYVFTITDNTPVSQGGPIVKHVEVDIIAPAPYFVSLIMTDASNMQATVSGAFTGWFYWLLDGVVIDSNQTGEFNYTTPGVYSCYVETHPNALDQQCWAYSNNINLTEVGTEEYENNGLSIYPNPNNGSFTIELKSFSNSEVIAEIYNIEGRVVHRINNSDFNGLLHLDNLNLEKGIYQTRIQNGQTQYRAKIVIQ